MICNLILLGLSHPKFFNEIHQLWIKKIIRELIFKKLLHKIIFILRDILKVIII